ncbi:hypothetical protein Hypma_005980 [Hypsizygus marmoreus]|uniref:Uncharacterized protein n=1 Tax=Hypsizygus marmoreus TaxID=39966 RepID=A0A369KCS2_HYPMA|nr:hypothetical protein Hypma_005980 [Hypsizygus marmoreus]
MTPTASLPVPTSHYDFGLAMYRIAQSTCKITLKSRSIPRLRLGLYHTSFPVLKSLLQPSPTDSSATSKLGLRSQLPPDSNSSPTPPEPPQLSDQDWEIRTGRAIYLLQQTLPEFFHVGLITSFDSSTGAPRPAGATPIPVLNANPLDTQVYGGDDVEGIYSPRISLSYTPPMALPAPFPTTLHIEGLPLYMASSAFIRHTLNALYSDLHVSLRKVVVNTPPSPASTSGTSEPPQDSRPQSTKRKSREKSLLVGLAVTGTARVSGHLGEWEVNSTYMFSPTSGLIHKHIVDSIYPAPHHAVYDSLRSSLGKVFGLGMGDGSRTSGGAAFKTGAAAGAGEKGKG